MIIDARELPQDTVLETTVCIAGGGAAGLTLASHLLDRNIPVCLVESGGFDFGAATQDLAAGESVGREYDPAETRFRFYGGSTNAWGGLVRPISSHCFGKRSWVENAAWPFARRHIDPYFKRAYDFLGVREDQLNPQLRLREVDGLGKGDGQCEENALLDDECLETRITPLTRPEVFKDLMRLKLPRSPGFRLLLYANAVKAETTGMPNSVQKLHLRTLCGKRLACKAKFFVAALGGIENARLLLLSNDVQSEGLGNTHDLVGRYFMDHPHIVCGRLRPFGRQEYFDFYDPVYRFSRMPSIASLSLTKEVQRQESLLDHRFYIPRVYRGQDCPGYEALRWLIWKMRATRSIHLKDVRPGRIAKDAPMLFLAAIGRRFRANALFKHFAITQVVEQAPNPDSRVMLCRKLDALGCNRVRVDWRLGGNERHTLIKSMEVLAKQFREKRLGNVEIDKSAVETNFSDWKSSWHHMGTTRMDPSPKHGVVDTDCRLHGTQNFYLAGSSVFPSGGDDVPTLTIVALAIRLADHLAARLRKNSPS